MGWKNEEILKKEKYLSSQIHLRNVTPTNNMWESTFDGKHILVTEMIAFRNLDLTKIEIEKKQITKKYTIVKLKQNKFEFWHRQIWAHVNIQHYLY